jgi:hypothetical protein
MRKMDRAEQLRQITHHKDDFDKMLIDMERIKKWFEDNELKLSGCAYDLLTEIESAIDCVGDASFECDCLLDDINAEIEADQEDP